MGIMQEILQKKCPFCKEIKLYCEKACTNEELGFMYICGNCGFPSTNFTFRNSKHTEETISLYKKELMRQIENGESSAKVKLEKYK